MKKILVTGGTGFLGSALVRRLLAAGHRVRVIDNNWRGNQERLSDVKDQFEFLKVDICDESAVKNACRDVDTVFHLAFINGTEFFYSKPEAVLEVGVAGMVNILRGAIAAGVKEFFLASSSEVYQAPPKIPTDESVPLSIPDPLNPRYSYAGGKIISELMAINYGRNHFERVVVFRPHNVYGPDMGWEHVLPQFILRMNKLATLHPTIIPFPIQGTGKETRAFVYIDDFIGGLMDLLRAGKHLNIYHIGNSTETSIVDLVQVVAQHFNRTAQIIPGTILEGSVSRRCPDISKISALGYKAVTPLAEGVRQTAQWYTLNAHCNPHENRNEDQKKS